MNMHHCSATVIGDFIDKNPIPLSELYEFTILVALYHRSVHKRDSFKIHCITNSYSNEQLKFIHVPKTVIYVTGSLFFDGAVHLYANNISVLQYPKGYKKYVPLEF